MIDINDVERYLLNAKKRLAGLNIESDYAMFVENRKLSGKPIRESDIHEFFFEVGYSHCFRNIVAYLLLEGEEFLDITDEP